MEVITQLGQFIKYHKGLSDIAFTAVGSQYNSADIQIDDKKILEVIPELGYYYYLYDTVNHEIIFVSESIEPILGIARAEFNLNVLFNHVHLKDRSHILACEALFCQYFSSYINRRDYTSYTSSYCFRVRVASGLYHLLLHQGIAYSIDRNGFIRYMLYVDRLIEHAAVNNSMLASFKSSNGSPSYLGIDPYSTNGLIKFKNISFTKREEEIISMLSKGFTAEEIAGKLHLSFNTIRTHKQNLLRKAGVKNSIELVALALKMGVL
jgi:DNA-binding CsgD family transcriptional regulator